MNAPHDNQVQHTANPESNPAEAGADDANSAPPPEPQPPTQSESPDADRVLLNLREQLQELRQRFDATDAQIAGYLRETASAKVGPANGEAIAHIQQSLDRLLTRFEESNRTESPASEAAQATSGDSAVLDAIGKLAHMQKELAQKIVHSVAKRITEELDLLRFQQVVHETLTNEWDRREAEAQAKADREAEAALADPEEDIPLEEVELVEEEPGEEEPPADAWSRAIWGPDLTEMDGFKAYLDELNRRLLEGDSGASTLAGQLLVFRQAPPEAKPQLLKDVGEAYYRTRIDEAMPDRPFERALIRWLQKDCERAGLPNTIEVVHPGERFDKSRHSSTTRGGAEVSEVFGWIVLTEGGRVYTRASVAAQ